MKLYAHEYGAAQNDQPPLIILHGLFGSHDNWHTFSKNLAISQWVFGLDLRNHGRSPKDSIMSFESMAGDVLEFLEDRDLPTVSLLGHSLGGKVVMQFALSFPQRISKLIVVDIAPKSYPPAHDAILKGLLSLDLSLLSSRKDADRALAKTIKSAPVRQFLLKNMELTESGTYRWKLNLEAVNANYDAINAGINPGKQFVKPVLFIKGAQSDYVQEEDRSLIMEYFPMMRLVTLPTGHWVNADAPEQLQQLVSDFLLEN